MNKYSFVRKKLLSFFLILALSQMAFVSCTSGGISEDGEEAVANNESEESKSEDSVADGGTSESSLEGELSQNDESANDSNKQAENTEQQEEKQANDEITADLGEDVDGNKNNSEENIAENKAPEEQLDSPPAPEEPLPLAGGEDKAIDANSSNMDSAEASQNPPSSDVAQSEPVAETPIAEAPPAEPQASADPSPASTAESQLPTDLPAAKTSSSLKKIKDLPFEIGGSLMNAVYIARPNDQFKTVSEKIYGSDRESDVKKWNPSIKDMKPGDKIYYNSAKRPTDTDKIMNYYEEIGAQASTYVSKPGDNLKKVGANLLGHPKGWMELWVTNPVESKGKLPEGTELKYWPEGAVAAAAPNPAETTNAQNNPIVQDTGSTPPVAPPVAGTTGDTPSKNDKPEEPGSVSGSENTNPSTPPHAAAESENVMKKFSLDKIDSNNPTTLLGIGAIALFIIAGMIIVSKRSRSKRIEFTQA